MAISPHVRKLREAVGSALLQLPSVTGIVFDARERMLLVHDVDTDLWVAPGGLIEPGERPAEAVVRELREEIGVDVEPVGLLGVFGGDGFVVEYGNGDRTSYVMAVFECAIVAGEPAPDREEVHALRWVDRGELGALRLAPWAARVLPLVHEGRRRALFEEVRR
jgi:8-oxo-dGTP pyrophosphatase MutT (NUDIX family)